jgi:hypothetical protein
MRNFRGLACSWELIFGAFPSLDGCASLASEREDFQEIASPTLPVPNVREAGSPPAD